MISITVHDASTVTRELTRGTHTASMSLSVATEDHERVHLLYRTPEALLALAGEAMHAAEELAGAQNEVRP